MICHRCGGTQIVEQTTDLPFKLDTHQILVVKQLPALVCDGCGEIMLADAVMAAVDDIIERVRAMDCELEVVRYAA